jgi:hypothetical protein
VIAFEYCLRNSRLEVLKESYDPEHASLSPGMALRYLMIERERELGVSDSYHMGMPSGAGRATCSRCALRICGPSLKARALHRAGPALAQSLRLAVKGQPRLLSAIRWGRSPCGELRARLAAG